MREMNMRGVEQVLHDSGKAQREDSRELGHDEAVLRKADDGGRVGGASKAAEEEIVAHVGVDCGGAERGAARRLGDVFGRAVGRELPAVVAALQPVLGDAPVGERGVAVGAPVVQDYPGVVGAKCYEGCREKG